MLNAVLASVLTFIAKARFPRNKSIADVIRQRYGIATLKQFRDLERHSFKLGKCKLDVQFF